MRLLTFSRRGTAGPRRLGLVVDDRIVDVVMAARSLGLGDGVPDTMINFIAAGDKALDAARRVASVAEAGNLTDGQDISFAVDAVKVEAPIARPGKIICLGLNYREHAAEGGREAPTVPVLFAKFTNTIIGPGDPIVMPKASSQVDYEAEFAVVIGRLARRVSERDAFDYVLGYTCMNDVSARDLQREQSQWLRGKSPDTFGPTGPYIVTKDEVPDPHNLDIRLVLNGEVMQQSNTQHLIFNVPFLIEHITKTMTLEPGDIISTGTPSGVGVYRTPQRLLRPGDRVRVEVERVGALENPVIAEE